MPSSCRAAPSPRRATRTAAAGFTGCGRPPIIGPSSATKARTLFAPGTVKEPLAPNRLRWDPPADLPADADFVDGMVTMLANRDPADLEGVAVHLYRASKSMERRVFVDADGELLIIPQSGALRIVTELGRMEVAPGWVGPRPARDQVPRRGRGRSARLCRGKSRASASACPSSGRSAPTASPIRATSRRPVAWFEDQRRANRGRPEIARVAVDDDARPFAARCRRLARQLRALALRSCAVQCHRHASASTIPIRRSSPS